MLLHCISIRYAQNVHTLPLSQTKKTKNKHSCKLQQQAIKQLAIRRLPPVLCFHLKTFAHHASTNTGRKLDTHLHFPLSALDMRPYLATTVLQHRYKLPVKRGRDGEGLDQRPVLYDCTCVVVHKGSYQGGHYVSYVRSGDAWYLCDDAYVQQVCLCVGGRDLCVWGGCIDAWDVLWVYVFTLYVCKHACMHGQIHTHHAYTYTHHPQVPEDVVQQSQAYMLFYTQRLQDV